jgi:hypothetical protein
MCVRDIVNRIRKNRECLAPSIMDEAADEIERLERANIELIAERDEARREYCFAFAELTTEPTWEPPTHEQAAKLVANKRGWSCFKDDGK